jgi:hypothetical protein
VGCKDFIKVYGLKDGEPLSQDYYIFDEWIVVELDLKNLPTDGTHTHFCIMKWGEETSGGVYIQSITFLENESSGEGSGNESSGDGTGNEGNGNEEGTWEGIEI